MSESRALRETLGPKEDEVTADWMGGITRQEASRSVILTSYFLGE
jgi:hypothetical protein